MLRTRLLGTTVLTAVALSAGPASAEVDKIIVTATKKEESAQDVPVAVNAIGERDIEDLDVGNFSDYIRYLPNVSFAGRGPGQNVPFIRGQAVQPIAVQLSGVQGTQPNVALYLDEQPVTAPGRNLDVYITDIERIEVLPGPQGTLFGASSMAGTIRIITNKPDFSGFSAGVDSSVGFTEGGEMSNSVEGFVNIPIVDDILAVRGAFFVVKEGGYIDNTQGTFTTDPSINPNSTATPTAVSYESASNVDLVEDDFNGATYNGVRLSASWLINEDWDLLLQHTHQELQADGVFDYDPEVGDLKVNRFFPDYLDDKFHQTSWTLSGRLAMLDVLYTGAYLEREIDQSIDYTGYNNSGAFVSYYTCTYQSTYYSAYADIVQADFITPGGRECLDPTKGAKVFQEHFRNTHELRVNTPSEWRIRATAGVFYDDFEIETQDDFIYAATPALGFAPNAPISGAVQINPSTRPAGVAFFNDARRTDEQIAFFGELEFDIVPDMLTFIAGARYYDIETDFEGSSNFANGIFTTPEIAQDDIDSGRDYDEAGSGGDPNAAPVAGAPDPNVPGHSKEPLELSDTIFKLSLKYTPTVNTLFYATWSEGFRPGGFNRGGGVFSRNPTFPTVRTTYESDELTNWELGWKTLLFNNDLQFNGAAYFIEWENMQVSRFDPQNVSILTFIENGANSEILGIESDVVWTPTDEITLFGAVSYNDTELTEIFAEAVDLAPIGSELPLVPKLQATARARYDTTVNDYNVFGQLGIQYADESFSSLVREVREEQDSYVTMDASFGVGRDNWRVSVFVENLTDERAELFINEQDDIRRITTNRPRTITLRASVDFD